MHSHQLSPPLPTMHIAAGYAVARFLSAGAKEQLRRPWLRLYCCLLLLQGLRCRWDYWKAEPLHAAVSPLPPLSAAAQASAAGKHRSKKLRKALKAASIPKAEIAMSISPRTRQPPSCQACTHTLDLSASFSTCRRWSIPVRSLASRSSCDNRFAIDASRSVSPLLLGAGGAACGCCHHQGRAGKENPFSVMLHDFCQVHSRQHALRLS